MKEDVNIAFVNKFQDEHKQQLLMGMSESLQSISKSGRSVQLPQIGITINNCLVHFGQHLKGRTKTDLLIKAISDALMDYYKDGDNQIGQIKKWYTYLNQCGTMQLINSARNGGKGIR